MPPARFALHAGTACVLATTIYALAVRPPPFGWAILALAAYTGLLLGGVFVLRWRVFVDAVVRGPPGTSGVALTFDDGPDPVGLHSYAHDRLFALRRERRVRRDLALGIATLETLTGHRPLLFRPPIGHTNPTIARVADALGLVVVGWTIGGRDGLTGARATEVAARVRRDLREGAIVLLHDAAERGQREPAAIRALPAILDAIEAARLEIVPLDTWIARTPSMQSKNRASSLP